MATTPTPPSSPAPRAPAMAARLFLDMLATQELLTAYLGVRLGLYEELARAPATAPELAARAGIDARYAREWLEQQAVAGILTAEGTGADERRFELPAEHAAVLRVSDDPSSLASLAILPLGAVARALPALLDAYRSGAGVPDEIYGDDWRQGHGGANRALFTHLVPGWLPAHLPELHERLTAPGARIADVACGAGWAAIALAHAYRHAAVDGFDIDAETVEDARRHAASACVGERVLFRVHDVSQAPAARYDLVCLFDSLHEMPRPVEVLRSCRAMRAEGGTVLVLDARVADRFVAPGGEIERFQYATSVLHCLPVGRVAEGAEPTGTVLRPGAVRDLARRAGFADARIVPVEERFHRLYRLIG